MPYSGERSAHTEIAEGSMKRQGTCIHVFPLGLTAKAENKSSQDPFPLPSYHVTVEYFKRPKVQSTHKTCRKVLDDSLKSVVFRCASGFERQNTSER